MSDEQPPGAGADHTPPALPPALEIVPARFRQAMEQLVLLATSISEALTDAERLLAQVPPEHAPAARAAFAAQQVAALRTIQEIEVLAENLFRRIGPS